MVSLQTFRMRAANLYLFLTLLIFSTGCEYQQIVKKGSNADKLAYADKMYEKGTYIKALPLYEELLGVYNRRQDGERIYFRYAMCHYQMADYTVAAYHFKMFGETFVTSSKLEDAAYYYAICQVSKTLPYYLDQSQTKQAMEQLQLFINRFPDSKYVEDCNKRMDDLRRDLQLKSYKAAMAYYHRGLYNAAVVSFKNTLISYPDIEEKPEMEFLIVESSYLYAQKSILSKQVERYADAITESKNYLKDHPKDDKFYEKVLEIKGKAEKELGQVKDRIARLEAEEKANKEKETVEEENETSSTD